METNKYRNYFTRNFRSDCHAVLKVYAEENNIPLERALNEAVRIGLYHLTGIDVNVDRVQINDI